MEPIPADEIADVWHELESAAAAGDDDAQAFLGSFRAWAEEQLAGVVRH